MSGIISARLVSRSCYARRAKATRQPGKRSSIVSSVSSGLPHALTGWRPPTPPMSSRSHGCASWRTWTASTIPSDSAGGSLLPRDASAFASSAYAGASSLPRRPAYSTDRSTTQSRVRYVTAERDRALRRALSGLDQRCQALLRLLAAADPPSYEEIGAALGMAIGAIGPTRGRCLEKLRRSPELAELELR